MTRAKKVKQLRRQQREAAPPPRSLPRGYLLLGALAVAGVAALVAVLVLTGGEERRVGDVAAGDPGPVHVHGLGVDPADGALFIATHSGLYRAGPGERRSRRVGDRLQDTMGFAVVGENRFLGSGHPDLREAQEDGLPPLLGLIESTDAGRSWQPISLLGKADFHVLRFAGDRVYGYDSSNGRLMASDDRGRSWRELEAPSPVVDIAVDPGDPRHLLAATQTELSAGLSESTDAGESWRPAGPAVGLLAWPRGDRLFVLDGTGLLSVSRDGGDRFQELGEIGGQPAAFLAQGEDELYVALHDGTIKRSTDGGRTWVVRSAP